MAHLAMAQETICSLRREIARIEGTLSERLAVPGVEGETVLRRGISAARQGVLPFIETGVPELDLALGGGVPRAALTEIHGAETRDAGAAAGATLALISLMGRTGHSLQSPKLCWIGTADLFGEAGFPYGPGLKRFFGLSPDDLLFSSVRCLPDALWIAEEAARVGSFSAVILEIRGSAAPLDLTATRRLHRRAQEAGHPVFLIRQAASAEPTAAPVRLLVSPAPAAARPLLAGSLAESIGNPAFTLSISKSRTALPGNFILEWNPDELAFHEIRPTHSGAVVSAPFLRPHFPAAGGAVVAPQFGRKAAPGDQPARGEHPAHRRARRAG